MEKCATDGRKPQAATNRHICQWDIFGNNDPKEALEAHFGNSFALTTEELAEEEKQKQEYIDTWIRSGEREERWRMTPATLRELGRKVNPSKGSHDGIPGRLWWHLPERAEQHICALTNSWTGLDGLENHDYLGKATDEWKSSHTTLIPKTAKMSRIKDLRPIAGLTSWRKILGWAIGSYRTCRNNPWKTYRSVLHQADNPRKVPSAPKESWK